MIAALDRKIQGEQVQQLVRRESIQTISPSCRNTLPALHIPDIRDQLRINDEMNNEADEEG
jgi:hypothetical protein